MQRPLEPDPACVISSGIKPFSSPLQNTEAKNQLNRFFGRHVCVNNPPRSRKALGWKIFNLHKNYPNWHAT